YIIKRILMVIVIMIAAAFVIFTILYFTPGDPARNQLGPTATAADVENLRAVLGLDKSYLAQLASFMSDTFLHLDLGTSWTYNVPVMQELLNRLPYTVFIGLTAMILNVAVGLSLGIFAATHEGRWQDSVSMVIAMVFISIPDFWLALMMIVLFAQRLGWLPAYGVDSWKSFIMPIIVMSLPGIAVNARQTRSSMLEVFRADYITTARAKGQAEGVVVRRHMLPNALMPIITSLGTGFSSIVAGGAVIESVFSIPGVGLYMLTGINSRDYPIVRGCVVFFALFTSIAMLVVDLAYAFVDPRIKAQYSSSGKLAGKKKGKEE
ncbi:MAG: ABC transporter permease, partial [Lachnospiraceae bacterium]|nr:ABC transporter permease [Lachnospiraceae bacterium]